MEGDQRRFVMADPTTALELRETVGKCACCDTRVSAKHPLNLACRDHACDGLVVLFDGRYLHVLCEECPCTLASIALAQGMYCPHCLGNGAIENELCVCRQFDLDKVKEV